MLTRQRRVFVFGGAFIIAALSAISSVRSSPIDGEHSSDNRVQLSNSVHPLVWKSVALGPADPASDLEGVTLRFSRTPSQQADLDALLVQQQIKRSPEFRKWVTPEQFAERFGQAPETIAKVSTWLTSQNLHPTEVARSGEWIRFSGKAGDVAAALGTSLMRYSLHGKEYLANATAVRLPPSIGAVVSGVDGLTTFRLHPHVKAAEIQQRPEPRLTAAQGVHLLAPADIWTIYDTAPIYSAMTASTPSYNLAVAGQTAITASDIANFRSAAGLPSMSLNQILVPGSGSPVITPSDEIEADLDLEWSGALAPNAQVVYVYAGNNPNYSAIDALQYAIDNNLAPVVSVSYGACEAEVGSQVATELQQLIQQGNAQGQTIVAAAGDTGATDCDDDDDPTQVPETIATQGLAVDLPAAIPEVTGMGGSEFNEGQGSYWNATNAGNGASAKGYIPEMVWNDTTTDGNNTLQGGGGGASTFFKKPTWQSAPGVPKDGQRDVPDVSLAASPNHDGYVVCNGADSTQDGLESCTDGFADAKGYLNVFGGTSIAAPQFAGALTAIEESEGVDGLGNINPTLYTAASTPSTYASAFHDIVTGNNSMPCQTGSIDCPSGGEIGFNAGVGYDQATGLGSLDFAKLAAAMNSGPASTTVSISPSVTAPAVGQPVTYSAFIQGAAGQPPPTGTVQFSVDGQSQGTAVSVTSNAAALTYSATAAGNYTISASYSGDTHYKAATGTLSISVGSIPTTVVLTAPTTSPQPGQSFAIGAQITGVTTAGGALTGTVQFSVNGTNSGNPVTLNSNQQASFSVSEANAGQYTIGAVYSGAGNYATSTGQVVVSVGGNPSTVTVTAATSAPIVGQSVVYSATVATVQGSPVPSGTIQFSINGAPQAAPQTLSGGAAQITYAAPAAGALVIGASYSGDANYQAGSGATKVSVVANGTSLALVLTPNNPAPGATVNVAATVSAPTGTAVVPAGSIQFSVNGTTSGGAIPLSNGGATFSTSIGGKGAYTISGVYTSSNGLGSSTGQVSVTVQGLVGTIALTPSGASLPSGTPAKFTATITPPANGPVATGTIQFSIDGVSSGSPVNVVNGSAAFSTTFLTLGTHSVSCQYSGDTNYAAGSATATETVTGGTNGSDVELQLANQSPQIGDADAATISINTNGTGAAPTGTVQFAINGTNTGSPLTLVNGAAAGSVTFTEGGPQTLTATYSGDSTYESSTALFTLEVSRATANLAINSSPGTPAGTTQLTLNATGPANGLPMPSGSVVMTFPSLESEQSINLVSGSATVMVQFPGTGTYTVISNYSGDANYAPSQIQTNVSVRGVGGSGSGGGAVSIDLTLAGLLVVGLRRRRRYGAGAHRDSAKTKGSSWAN